MKKFRVVLTRTIVLDHAEYEAKDEKDAEKLASQYFSKCDLWGDDSDMEIEEIEDDE